MILTTRSDHQLCNSPPTTDAITKITELKNKSLQLNYNQNDISNHHYHHTVTITKPPTTPSLGPSSPHLTVDIITYRDNEIRSLDVCFKDGLDDGEQRRIDDDEQREWKEGDEGEGAGKRTMRFCVCLWQSYRHGGGVDNKTGDGERSKEKGKEREWLRRTGSVVNVGKWWAGKRCAELVGDRRMKGKRWVRGR